ncbi:Uncharacterised protein [Mycobacteroides abscessus]|nr:Uncharacterised protein [Mycobacteroides abscessus]SKU19490.1 Uncharacterised protein [Mycobacteroides abscessus subsp. abscessus]
MGGKGDGLLTRATLPVDGGTRHLFRVSAREPGQTSGISGLPTDGIKHTHVHVVDGVGIDVDAVEQTLEGGRTQIQRVHLGQRAVALTDSGTHSVNDVRLRHGESPYFSGLFENDPTVIPPRTIERYCSATSCAVREPPGRNHRTDTQVASRMNRYTTATSRSGRK